MKAKPEGKNLSKHMVYIHKRACILPFVLHIIILILLPQPHAHTHTDSNIYSLQLKNFS